MGRYGNPQSGLLKYMLQVIHENGQTEEYDSDWVTDRVAKLGFWNGSGAKTPYRTVNSFFSENPSIFERVGDNRYCLRMERYRVPELKVSLDNLGEETPSRIWSKKNRCRRTQV